MAVSKAGERRTSARAIDASDFRIPWKSLVTDARRGFGKPASAVDLTVEMVLRGGSCDVCPPSQGRTRPHSDCSGLLRGFRGLAAGAAKN